MGNAPPSSDLNCEYTDACKSTMHGFLAFVVVLLLLVFPMIPMITNINNGNACGDITDKEKAKTSYILTASVGFIFSLFFFVFLIVYRNDYFKNDRTLYAFSWILFLYLLGMSTGNIVCGVVLC